MDGFDLWVLRFVANHRTYTLSRFARWLLEIGLEDDPVLVFLAIGGVVFVIATRRWRVAVAAALAFVAASFTTSVLKDVIQRPRPPPQLSLVYLGSYAMPSTHAARTAAIATAFVCSLTWVGRRTRIAVAAALAAAVVVVGATMVYLGGHWLTDVLAGWVLGGAIGWAAARLVNRRRSCPARSGS